MTKKNEGWLSRRGQAGAATAVELVLERQPQEPVQQIADALIEDSPYQARQPISDTSIAELAQGMASAGFQGVLIVRPHGDVAKRGQGQVQLVYGHRRRAAWRLVCHNRGEPCVLPVVVRKVSDAQMLTIGAQENLQRQDLDPVEEAQIVAWAERMFFDKNQAEIGAMLGKSSDWVSTRSRIHKLPDELKDALRQRPRAIKQVLELALLYGRDMAAANALAERVVQEHLTVEAVRQHIAEHHRPVEMEARDETHECRAGATFVPPVTSKHHPASPTPVVAPTATPEAPELRAAQAPRSEHRDTLSYAEAASDRPDPALGTLLQEAAAALALVAQQRERLPRDSAALRALDQMRRDLAIIGQVLE
ncbi:MAG: hypothetical protein RLZZ387_1719 [Chloroflexota bacterium]|jgi:ParB/RepB/Spo0J family partition protein